jgi:hypothetical protein
LALEAAENFEWASDLSDEEARRAALHGCLSQQSYPAWIDSLIDSHPLVVAPIVNRVIQQE